MHQDSYRYGRLTKAICGVVFLGTPHSSASNNSMAVKEQSVRCLQLVTSLGTNTVDRLTREASAIEQINHLFDQAQLRIDVLTVYETLESKLQRRFGPRRSTVVSHAIAIL